MATQDPPEKTQTPVKEPAKAASPARFSSNLDFFLVGGGLLLVPLALIVIPRYLGHAIDYWICAIWFYIALALASFVPVWRAASRRITPKEIADSLSKAKTAIDSARPVDPLEQPTKDALFLNFDRLAGTLIFWKFEAAKYRAAHYYCLFWTIPSAVLIPILTQAVGGSSGGATLVTIISAFTAILLAFHKGLKIEENFRAFRHGESEFYDLWRRMLDRPSAFGGDAISQLKAYVIETETIRRFVRNAETNNMATLDEARQMLKSTESKKGP